MHRTVPSLKDYLGVVIRSFRVNHELVECIENLCGGNIRIALGYLADFLGSGHVDTDDILQDKTHYIIAQHQFLRAIIYRDQVCFDPHSSDVTNVFDVLTASGKEHFLLLIAIAQLDHWARVRKGDGFVETGEAFATLQSIGFSPEEIAFSLERGVSSRLLQVVDGASSVSIGDSPHIRVTTTGGYYYRSLCRKFTYIDSMIIDTPIVDQSFREKISYVSAIGERLNRAETFMDYLDLQWRPLFGSECVLNWAEISADIRSDISEVRGRSNRDRKHHY